MSILHVMRSEKGNQSLGGTISVQLQLKLPLPSYFSHPLTTHHVLQALNISAGLSRAPMAPESMASQRAMRAMFSRFHASRSRRVV